jgi:hypothetical protein
LLLTRPNPLHAPADKPVLRRPGSQAGQRPASRLVFARDPLTQLRNLAAQSVALQWHGSLLILAEWLCPLLSSPSLSRKWLWELQFVLHRSFSSSIPGNGYLFVVSTFLRSEKLHW